MSRETPLISGALYSHSRAAQQWCGQPSEPHYPAHLRQSERDGAVERPPEGGLAYHARQERTLTCGIVTKVPQTARRITNIPSSITTAGEVITDYHSLWHVEQSSRMSKHDLHARPISHHTHHSIEAHLTVVTASLAIAHHLQAQTRVSIKKIIRPLRGM